MNNLNIHNKNLKSILLLRSNNRKAYNNLSSNAFSLLEIIISLIIGSILWMVSAGPIANSIFQGKVKSFATNIVNTIGDGVIGDPVHGVGYANGLDGNCSALQYQYTDAAKTKYITALKVKNCSNMNILVNGDDTTTKSYQYSSELQGYSNDKAGCKVYYSPNFADMTYNSQFLIDINCSMMNDKKRAFYAVTAISSAIINNISKPKITITQKTDPNLVKTTYANQLLVYIE